MGLVDYSESESESELPQKAPAPKAPDAKKPFQKVVDRSKPGKIVVNLPQTSGPSTADEPPSKRARTDASEGGRFSGFNSFLPPPKNANKPANVASSSQQAKPKPGINLRTSAAPGFSRDSNNDADGDSEAIVMAPPTKHAEPTVPEDQTPAADVKLVGKPMMFKPLSVSRNSNKKKKTAKPPAAKQSASESRGPAASDPNGAAPPQDAAPPPPPKKVSLFSMHTEEPSEPPEPSSRGGVYQPLFEAPTATGPEQLPEDDYAQYAAAAQAQTGPVPSTGGEAESLESIAQSLNLSAAERRQLFGRGGTDTQRAKKVVNFNMDREYQHNEAIRASGEQQIHNPVRAVQGGKHNLRQLVQNVQSQRDALEDSFAKGKNNRKEAASKYGW